MSDYVQVTDYSAKDALASGNPAKLIKGSDVDAEFSAIAVAVATKFDSADLASQGTAEAGTDNTTLMTPLRTAQYTAVWQDGSVAAATGGIAVSADKYVLDLDALTNVTPAAGDEIAVADASDSGNPKAVLLSALATYVEGTLNHDTLTGFVANEHIDHSVVSISAGTGLTGGGTIAANRTISLSHLGLESLTDPNADRILFWDDSGGAAAWLTAGTGLSITATTIDVATSSATQAGIVELATTAETNTGTDTTRAITPGGFAGTVSLGTDASISGTSSLGQVGYYVFPGGFTMQWGYVTAVGGDSYSTVTFPRAFTEVYSVSVTAITSNVNITNNLEQVENVGATTFRLYNGNGSSADYYWIAVGLS